jgi:hypothetical protein
VVIALRRFLVGACALVATLGFTASASAQQDVSQAQALFTEGRTAMEKGDYTTACAKFTASLALVQRASTMLNLAQCEQHEGKLVAASKHWKEGIALLPPDDERVAVSKERAAALAPRLPHLTVKLAGPPPDGARIEVDGASVPAPELAAGVPIDPGRHTVVLRVPGAADQRSSVDVVEGEAKTVTLAPEAAPPTPKPSSSGGGLRTAGFALISVGVAGGIVVAVTGGILVSKRSTINAECPHMTDCTGSTWMSDIASTKPFNVVNGIGWGVGLAGLASGVALVVVGGKAPAAVGPTALPGGGGLSMSGRF